MQAGRGANTPSGAHPTVKPEVSVSRRTKPKVSGGEFDAHRLLPMHPPKLHCSRENMKIKKETWGLLYMLAG